MGVRLKKRVIEVGNQAIVPKEITINGHSQKPDVTQTINIGEEKIIFDKNIEGKNIYDTVFNYYESSSQLLSTLQFNLACSFGSDDVQWDMIK